jgi:hypothetical protein
MTERKWWTVETTFVGVCGVLMAVVLGTSFFARFGSQAGSALIPAKQLEEMRHAPIAALEKQNAVAAAAAAAAEEAEDE